MKPFKIYRIWKERNSEQRKDMIFITGTRYVSLRGGQLLKLPCTERDTWCCEQPVTYHFLDNSYSCRQVRASSVSGK